MEQKKTVFSALLVCLLFSSGCALWHEDDGGTEPVTIPYAVLHPGKMPAGNPSQTSALEASINEAASAVSLKMALSGKGPFKILSVRKPAPAGEKILRSLYHMGLIVPTAKDILYYSDTVSGGILSIRFGTVLNGSDFYTISIPIQEKRKK